MNSEKTGVVRLEDLSRKDIYIKLSKNSFSRLIEQIGKKGKITHFLKDNNLDNSNFWDWYTDKSLIRLDNFIKLKRCLNIKKLNILGIRGKQGKFLRKLSFNFKNKAGVRLIASILGDGCVHKKGIRYRKGKSINGWRI